MTKRKNKENNNLMMLSIIAALSVIAILFIFSQFTIDSPDTRVKPTAVPIQNIEELETVTKQLDSSDLGKIDKDLNSINSEASGLY